MRATVLAKTIRSPKPQGGFSLLELLVSMILLVVITGVAFQAISTFQKTSGGLGYRAEMHSQVRSAAELLEQEIGQAGLVDLQGVTLSSAITATGLQTASIQTSVTSVSNTTLLASLYKNEVLTVDVGAKQENVTLTASGAFTGVFAQTHAAGAPVTANGIIPQGVISITTSPTNYISSTGSDSSAPVAYLNLVGDMNGDGTLMFVQYACAIGSSASPGTLTRSATPVSQSTINPAVTLISGLIPNPNGATCFAFPYTLPGGETATVGATTYTFMPSVSLTVTTQTAFIDPQTGQFPPAMTKSFLNMAPRNVLYGYNLANAGLGTALQPLPSTLP